MAPSTAHRLTKGQIQGQQHRRNLLGGGSNLGFRKGDNTRQALVHLASWWPIRTRKQIWEAFLLLLIVLVAIGLNFMQLSQNGFGNTYYAATVKSMLTSWRHLFFAAYDPVGFLSVDKPPLGFWIQAASAVIFGFQGISLLVPQAMAGVLSVVILYALLRKTSGPTAALIAAALLSISPVNVVVNRSNIFESLVVLTSLGAAWAVLKALERRSIAWLIVCGALIGLGFNIKGLEAWLILPAISITYLCAVDLPVLIRLRHFAILAITVFVISTAWVIAIDLVPANQRPYVDSTLTNSEFDLMFNYNGLQRLVGEPGYNGNAPVVKHDKGDPGPIRLFQSPLGGQVSWFLPMALIGLLALCLDIKRASLRMAWQQRHLSPSQTMLLFWGSWFFSIGGFFSVALRFNTYYLAILAPAVCAIASFAMVWIWPGRRTEIHHSSQPSAQFNTAPPLFMSTRNSWLFALAFGATGIEQLIILSDYPDWAAGQTSLLIAVCVVGTLLLINGQTLSRMRDTSHRWQSLLQIVSVICWAMLLIVPLRWTVASLTPEHSGEFPISGPTPLDHGNVLVPEPDPALVNYLLQHARSPIRLIDLEAPARSSFLIGTTAIEDASALYLKTDRAVMALGGFSGYDPILTPDQLALRVASGQVEMFLIPSSNLSIDQALTMYPEDITASDSQPGKQLPYTTQFTNELTHWISTTCLPVLPDQWQTSYHFDPMQLYSCAPDH